VKGDRKELTYNLTYKEVVDVLRLINESGTCKEFHLELGDLKLIVIREINDLTSSPGVSWGMPKNDASEELIPNKITEEDTLSSQNTRDHYKENSRNETNNMSEIPVKAPMVGTFYRSPAPGEPPFVEVGSEVKEDDIIGIIDVMKLMNTIKAGYKGIIRGILVENEQIVEYDQVLMIIDPVQV